MQEEEPERGRIVGRIVPASQFLNLAAVDLVAKGGKVFRPKLEGPAGFRDPDLTSENTDFDALSSDSK
jgi:hypothetical protein